MADPGTDLLAEFSELVALLGSSSGKEAESAAWRIGEIARLTKQQWLSKLPNAAPALVKLLSSPRGREAENAAHALRFLGLNRTHARFVREAHPVPALAKLLRSAKRNEASKAAGAFATLQDRGDFSSETISGLCELLQSAKPWDVVTALRSLNGQTEVFDAPLVLVARSGVLSRLMELAVSREKGVGELAKTVLIRLAHPRKTKTLLVNAGAIPWCVAQIHAREHWECAVAVLRPLALVAKYRPLMVVEGVLPAILRLRPGKLSSRRSLSCLREMRRGLLADLSTNPSYAAYCKEHIPLIRPMLCWEEDIPGYWRYLEHCFPALWAEIRAAGSFSVWQIKRRSKETRWAILEWRAAAVTARYR
jgi:hypothetical protein